MRSIARLDEWQEFLPDSTPENISLDSIWWGFIHWDRSDIASFQQGHNLRAKDRVLQYPVNDNDRLAPGEVERMNAALYALFTRLWDMKVTLVSWMGYSNLKWKLRAMSGKKIKGSWTQNLWWKLNDNEAPVTAMIREIQEEWSGIPVGPWSLTFAGIHFKITNGKALAIIRFVSNVRTDIKRLVEKGKVTLWSDVEDVFYCKNLFKRKWLKPMTPETLYSEVADGNQSPMRSKIQRSIQKKGGFIAYVWNKVSSILWLYDSASDFFKNDLEAGCKIEHTFYALYADSVSEACLNPEADLEPILEFVNKKAQALAKKYWQGDFEGLSMHEFKGYVKERERAIVEHDTEKEKNNSAANKRNRSRLKAANDNRKPASNDNRRIKWAA